MTDEEKIKELYKYYWLCMINKDSDGLRSIMSKDYVLIHMTGVQQDKEDFIKGLLSGTFNYFGAEHDDITVTVSADTAQMTGKSRVLASVYGGGKKLWHLRGDFTLRKENNDWKLTSSKASTY